MRTFILKQRVQAVLFKLSSIFIWTVYLVLAHTMADLSEASAGFSISPSTLAYTTTVGGPSQTRGVTVTNTGTSTVSVTWADSINWLGGTSGNTVTMLPGKSATITHTASPAGLGAGSYSGTATITGGGIIKQVVPVTLSVTSASNTTPKIGLAPTSLAFSGSVGGPNQARSVTVSNTGSTALSLTWADSLNWLCCIQPGITQTIQPGHSGVFTLTASMAGLTAGTHSGTATITGGGIKQVVPVTLSVGSASSTTPRIGLAPTSLAFSGSVGGPNQTRGVTVTNTGTSTVSVTWADSINWLGGTSGNTVTMLPGKSATITHTASPAGLGVGTYSGTATITGGGIHQLVPVTLTVTSPTVAGTASLTWKANSEPDLAGYKVYRGTSSGGYTAPDAILPKTTTSYTVTGLQTRTTYFFTITAYDKAGNQSPHSTEVSKSIY